MLAICKYNLRWSDMGLDGFSMGILGLNADMTSAQMAGQAEHIARKESETIIKDVTKTLDSPEVKVDDEEEDENFQEESKNKKKKKHDELDFDSSITPEEFDAQNVKEFSVRINPKTEMVELFSNVNNRIIETISPDDLMTLLSKLNSASGILVNRKI